jgi:streptogramin lyase
LEGLEERCLLSVTEFPIPTPASGADALLAGPDGNLWFLEGNRNQVGRITLAGDVTEYAVPTPNSGLNALTVGPDGNLWFTEQQANQIGRITPAGDVTEFPIPAARSAPEGITTGPDGNLWFVETEGGPHLAGAIGRVTPTGDFTEFPVLPQLNGGGEHAIVTGPDGNLWFTETGDIDRLNPGDGTVTKFRLPSSSLHFPDSIVVGPDGNLWFSDQIAFRTFNEIGRITPAGEVVEFPVPSGANPNGITVGPDGNLWFTERSNNGIGSITPDGQFREIAVPTFNSAPTRIAAAPDGNLWFTDAGRNRVVRFLDDGLPRPPFLPPTTSPAGLRPEETRVADLRQNGTLDVITLNAGDTSHDGSVSVLLGNGDGTFGAAQSFPAGHSPQSSVVADVNGDGILDLVVADAGSFRQNDGGLRLLLGNGDGTFQAPVDLLSGRNLSDVVAGDFNGDGKLDLVVATDRLSLVPDPGVYELLGNGDGTFQPPARITPQTGPLAAGDFHHAGTPDLVVGPTEIGGDAIRLFPGNGDGTFRDPQVLRVPAGAFITRMLVGDLRQNGTLDLVVNAGFEGVHVFLGNGDGTLGAPVFYPASDFRFFGPAGLALGDFNGDGIPDLVTALGQSPRGTVSVLLGNGDGTFQEPRLFATGGSNPFGVAVGDFNGDRRDDVVVANTFSNNIAVLLNSGESWDVSGGPAADPRGADLAGPGRAAPADATAVPPAGPSTPATRAAAVDHLLASHRGEDAEFFLAAARRKSRAGSGEVWLAALAEDAVSL